MNLFDEEIEYLLEIFSKYNVRVILVGGLAVNFYGYPRTTGDIDFWLDDSEENRKKLVKSLGEFGVEGADILLKSPLVAGFSEILINSGIYLDLMAELQFFKQEKFNDCYKLAQDFFLNEKVSLKVLHINSLIEEKEKSTREKDKEDVIQLKKLRSSQQ